MGTQTLQRYNCDPLDAGVQWSEEGPTSRHDPGAAPVFPESTIAYRRWFWQTIEPTIPISTAKRCSGRRAICGIIGSAGRSRITQILGLELPVQMTRTRHIGTEFPERATRRSHQVA
jgi:hypothetical protein